MTPREIDAAITEAKFAQDRTLVAGNPTLRTLIRAAEAMRRQLFGSYFGDDPMPVFVIKAKDDFALATIAHYSEICADLGLHRQVAEVQKALDEMAEWRDRNPGLVQRPDHPHVAAG